jgi:hypothetical protein
LPSVLFIHKHIRNRAISEIGDRNVTKRQAITLLLPSFTGNVSACDPKGAGRTLRPWNPETAMEMSGRCSAIATSPNGRRLFFSCRSVRSGDVARNSFTSNVSACDPKGAGRTLRPWNPETATEMSGRCSAIATSANGRRLFCSCRSVRSGDVDRKEPK